MKNREADGAAGGAPGPAITPSPLRLPEPDGATFDAIGVARRLLRASGQGMLATLDPGSGYPLATLVTCAPALDGAPLFFLSALSLHTRNLKADPRVSLLLMAGGKGDPLAHPRLSLVGRCRLENDNTAKPRFHARHVKAALYADLPDFAMWRLDMESVHLNGGFARARALTPADLLCDMAGSQAFAGRQVRVLEELQQGSLAAISALVASPADHITLLGVDADGLDLRLGGQWRRLDFARRLAAPDEAMAAVAELMAGPARRVD